MFNKRSFGYKFFNWVNVFGNQTTSITQKPLLLLFMFRIVKDIQHINTYLVGYNSWSFHLSNIAVTYDLNTTDKR